MHLNQLNRSADDIIQAGNIPKELQERQQWVMWRYEVQKGKKKPTKVPYFSPFQHAKTTDPKTWLRFDEALRFLENDFFDGIGFVFTEDDEYVGIDLDNCKEGTQLTEYANEIMKLFNSYTEYSPSGDGLHIIVKVDSDFRFESRKDNVSGTECYQKLRYFSFTGNVHPNSNRLIENRTQQVETLLTEYLHPSSTEEYEMIPIEEIKKYTSNVSDQEVLQRLFSSAAKLNGTEMTFGHYNNFLYHNGHQGDASSDDWYFVKQLAYECSGDVTQIDRIFRESALFREKWDKKHYSNGDTYGQRTIYNAICAKKESIEKKNGVKDFQLHVNETNEQTLLPKGYIVKGEALFQIVEKVVSGDLRQYEYMICRQAPYISRSFTDIETSNLFYEIAWTDNNVQQKTIVPASGIAIKKELVALSNRSLAVTENNAKQLITYFDLYNMVNKRQREYLVSRLGHIKGNFIHPAIVEDITIMPSDIGEKQLLEAIHVSRDVEGWLKYVFEPIKAFPKALLMVLASFASVILKDLKLEPFIIDYAGETSNGKTTLLKACASVWATKQLMSEWNITPVALERKAVFLNSFPVLLDDSRKISDEKKVKNFIYNFSGGRSKGRGSLSGSQKEFTWNNILISTGEASLNAYAEQMGGVAARIVAIEGIPFPNVEPDFFTDLHNSMEDYYGAVGVEFLQHWKEKRESCTPEFKKYVEICQKKSENNPVMARVARNYAALIFTGKLLNTFFNAGIDLKAIYTLFDELVSENKALDKPKQLLEGLLKDLDADRRAIYYEYEPNVPIKALYKTGTLWITPRYLKEFLGVEEKAIRAAWQKRDYTYKFENRGKEVDYKQVRAGQQKFSCIGININIIDELGFDFSID